MLTTRQKLSMARIAQKAVMGTRSVLGLGPVTSVTRRNSRWVLDLREGIDFAIWLMGAFELSTVHAYERLIRPGQTVLDIGANIGAHTVPIARVIGPAGKVYAFEPTDYAFTKLKANMSANPDLLDRVACCQLMLTDKTDGHDVPALFSSWPLQDSRDSHALHGGQLMSASNARSTTLDRFLSKAGVERIDFIKVDIDGYECTMLRGATATLARSRPIMVVELSPHQLDENGSSIEELVEILTKAGYGLEDLSTGKTLPMDGGALRKIIPHGGSQNAIARPRTSAV